ncbi:hypothetical protein GPOL_c12720 [Gordonia polyisoprenivorans VH2]|uniref:Uncharacterized protein n=1 Tax=Gordonia polyisoprenivorans (strain DSM 44266 / VH2) TaxID=1112204 RepID=H6N3G8_GORPV|nr:hypothetical protein [Gordonia polyisoprenivorans]AFA72327.1 hypothetical protein GPOL_c12720 [Gordonia polyisoprenivorans VH2]
MKWWWQRDIEEARARADRAEREREAAERRNLEADRLREHAKEVEDDLHKELVRNGFAEALKDAFGGVS